MDQNLNVKYKTIKLLEDKIGEIQVTLGSVINFQIEEQKQNPLKKKKLELY